MPENKTKAEFFSKKKTQYFSGLGIETRQAIKIHQKSGHLEKDKDGQREWGNVTEHCLVEIARVKALGEKLGLSDQTIKNLSLAAALHDAYKKREIEELTKDPSWENREKIKQEEITKMQEDGFSPEVMYLAQAVGHDSLGETEKILTQAELSEAELAFLVIHYVDDYTSGSDWASYQNLEQRIAALEENPKYKEFNEEGREHFKGKTAYQKQLEVGRVVQQRLSELLEVNDPNELPLIIDRLIKQKINQIN